MDNTVSLNLAADVAQALLAEAQKCNVSVSDFLRKIVFSERKSAGPTVEWRHLSDGRTRKILTSTTGVEIDITPPSRAELERAREVFDRMGYARDDFEKVLQEGREAWVRERGY